MTSKETKDVLVTGYWKWDKWYDRIFRWKTVCFKVGDNTWKFRRNKWTIESGWMRFDKPTSYKVLDKK